MVRYVFPPKWFHSIFPAYLFYSKFNDRTTFEHSNTELVRYSDPHCKLIFSRCSTVISTGQLDGKHGHDRLTTGAWNPHQNCQQYASANEHQVSWSTIWKCQWTSSEFLGVHPLGALWILIGFFGMLGVDFIKINSWAQIIEIDQCSHM